MSKENAPCYGCKDRKVQDGYNCHSDCPRYLGYKDKQMKKSEAITQKRAEESMIVETRQRSMRRISGRALKRNPWKG